MAKRTLQELTIGNNFMFGAVMCDEENCKGLIEMVIGTPIDRIEVSKEKSMVYHPEYKGVRLDVYAKDEKNTHYNIEMQMLKNTSLGKRSRYYQSQIDMELLLKGNNYDELPNTYVIFICDFDPFGQKKYRYTFYNHCKESGETSLEDGRRIIYLSTRGENAEEVPKELVIFLKFVKADLKESQEDFHDIYVKQLQNSIRHIKESREMEERFMILEEMLRDERAAGRREGLQEGELNGQRAMLRSFLEDLGSIPPELEKKLFEESDATVLKNWLKIAATSKSIEEFIQKIQ